MSMLPAMKKRTRTYFQIHLSTALVAIMTCAVGLHLNIRVTSLEKIKGVNGYKWKAQSPGWSLREIRYSNFEYREEQIDAVINHPGDSALIPHHGIYFYDNLLIILALTLFEIIALEWLIGRKKST